MILPGTNASGTTSAFGRSPATVQRVQSASVTRPESVHTVLGRAAGSRTPRRPGPVRAGGDGRLAEVVQVVHETHRGNRGQPPAGIRPQQPRRVGLVLHRVPDADEPLPAGGRCAGSGRVPVS